MYYTIDDNNDHMFWVLILSIVCLCQGSELCMVCQIGKTSLRKGKQVLIMKKKSVAALTYTVTVRYYGLNSTM